MKANKRQKVSEFEEEKEEEQPQEVMLPVKEDDSSDYEVIEVKETKMPIKNVSLEKPIKISGGASRPDAKESSQKKKSEKRRSKKKRATKEEKIPSEKTSEEVSSSVVKRLFPPPSTLIQEKLTQFKNSALVEEGEVPPVEEAPPIVEETPPKEEEKE